MAHQSLYQCLRRSGSIAQRRYYGAEAKAFTVSKLLKLPPSNEQERQVFGFVRSIRKQKAHAFASIGDGSSLEPLQALLTPEQAQSLTTGSAICLTGTWKASPNARIQAKELHVRDVQLLGNSDPTTFPLQKKYQTVEYLRTMPHLRPRIPFNSLVLRLRSRAIAQITDFFARREFVQTHPPIITSSDCEGAGEVFHIKTGQSLPVQIQDDKHNKGNSSNDFFRSPKYLTVSTQLHLEALAQSVGKVWTLSPTFRAEKSDTTRHLSEFYMLEAEVSFTDQLDNIMSLVEDMLRDLTTSLYETEVGREIIHGKRSPENNLDLHPVRLSEEMEKRWCGMMGGPWPRITYTEAISILEKAPKSFTHDPTWGAGLQTEHEQYIARNLGEGKPVFVTKYPQGIKPFYMLPSEDNSGTVECFDLLVPGAGEITGGSMREHRLHKLLAAMQSHGLIPPRTGDAAGELPPDDALGGLKWYVDLRRWGSVSHGGFGLGFDRLISYLAGIKNIREAVAFPRWYGRCDC